MRRLAAAVRASIARISADWDQPDLRNIGRLSEDTLNDVWYILTQVQADARQKS